jgi:hypothetical protein
MISFIPGVYRISAGNHDPRRRVGLEQLAQACIASHARHSKIENHQVNGTFRPW